MVLVVGATGTLGGEICRRLRAGGKAVRALVRKTSDRGKVASLEELGTELVEGDLKERASLERACRGATVVISTPTAILARSEGDSFQTVDHDGQMQLVDSARAANVEQFVFISVSRGVGDSGNPLIESKRAVERQIQQSGLDYTILRPTFFMEIWLSPHLGFDVANAKATIYGSGNNPVSYISLADVAQFAVKALDNPGARNAVVELGGPEALTQLEVVALFEEFTGSKFDRQFVSEKELEARKVAAGNPVELTFADLMLAAAHGDKIDMTETMRKFSFQPRSVRDYTKNLLQGKQ
jgi:uncharacterized protein YbjT (DUF2867 family)